MAPKKLVVSGKANTRGESSRRSAYDTTFRRDSVVDMEELENCIRTLQPEQAMLTMAEPPRPRSECPVGTR